MTMSMAVPTTTATPIGGPEFEDDCSGIIDNDSDGVINDGCATVIGPSSEEGPGAECANAIDDDGDGFVNDGCAFDGIGETGAQCSNALNDDGDAGTSFNDGCPVVASETGAQCAGAVDNDADGVTNDGCPQLGGTETLAKCLDAVDDDSDLAFNDGCPVYPAAAAPAPGGFAVGFSLGEVGVGACANAIDDDADGVINDGCAASGAAESAANCTVSVDDDGDGVLNDGCVTFNDGESGGDCGDAVDGPDVDESVNDGCPAVGPAEVQQCTDLLDADADGKVNDGCSAFGTAETGQMCAIGNSVDDDGDGSVNDGCPRQGGGEAALDCNNGVDNDGDHIVDDGCPETGGQCADALDSDGDLVFDDGCFPPNEAGVQCDNWLDDDADTRINDGCEPTEAAAMARANTVDGVIKRASPYFTPGSGSVAAGIRNAVVITFTATSTNCVGTALTLSNVEMLDSLGEPVNVTSFSSSVGVASSADCDGDGDANAADNCPFISNGAQENADVDVVDMPGALADDATQVRSDTLGDACDADDDNDSRSDADEGSGAGCAGLTSNPLLRDTDGDRFVDGAECALGTNPGVAGSVPLLTACGGAGDTDLDKVADRIEFCRYSSSVSAIDSDGDADGSGGGVGLTKDGCEVASLNADRIVSSIDQGILASVISGANPYGLGADINKDGVTSSIDQGIMASFIVPAGQCP